MSIVFKGDTLFPRFPTPQATYLESNYSKIYVKQRQTGNTTSNRISFRVPYFQIMQQKQGSNFFATEQFLAVKSNQFVLSANSFRSFEFNTFSKELNVYVKLIVQVAGAEAEKNALDVCSWFSPMKNIESTEEFSNDEEIQFYCGLNKSSRDQRWKVTLTLLHTNILS